MKIKNSVAYLAGIAALVLAACSQLGGVAEDPLEGTSWELETLRDSSPLEGTSITAKFVSGEVSGSAGCNSYFGTYTLDGNQIRFDELAYTLMACLEPDGVSEQETAFMQFLGEASEYQLSEGRLLIIHPDGGVLSFVPRG